MDLRSLECPEYNLRIFEKNASAFLRMCIRGTNFATVVAEQLILGFS